MIATALLAILTIFGNLASAQPNPAIHIDESSCGMLNGNGGFTFGDRFSVVITHSGNGNAVCQGDVTPPSDGTAKKFNFENTGFLCNTVNGVTDKWQETISASGKATLICHTKP
ncbi:hypothetical protein EDB81DRAFT_298292 [Dactylonectria macrodidyma]|uniref:Uncharacterized protein n=1 Tax=Dactylonectria macrodidyma TaxID=307937 RepID=A0A9P9D8G2_9HYPO|nr:hypothetical protein EDB81DRAFT_298292 [Dactylonectria macrodidyma]